MQIDAHRFRSEIILMHRDHRAAEPRAAHAAQHEQDRDAHATTTHRQLRERADAAEAGGAAGRLEIEEEDADDLAEAERQDHQIDAAHAQRRRADDEPGNGRKQCAGRQRQRERHAALVSTALV